MSGFFLSIFIASILVAIALHELGHFATAKRFNIKVQEYFIGFGPRLWSVRRGETEYGVKAFPLGGYVKIAGMNPLEEVPPEDRGRVFKAAKPWRRAIVLAAGSFTHFVIGFLVIAGILWLSGVPQFEPTTTVRGISEDSAAERSGIREGDSILAVDGERVTTWDETVEAIQQRGGEEVVVLIRRDDQRIELGPVELEARTGDDGRTIGFFGVGPELEQVGTIERSWYESLGESGKQTVFLMRDSLFAFRQIFAPDTLGRLFSVAAGTQERTLEDPATIVGVGAVASDFGRNSDWVGLLGLIAGFNIFIGVANLLPLPPLDGGHLAVLAYEKIRNRDVDMRKLLPLTATVIAIFASLFVLLLFLDIVRPLPLG